MEEQIDFREAVCKADALIKQIEDPEYQLNIDLEMAQHISNIGAASEGMLMATENPETMAQFTLRMLAQQNKILYLILKKVVMYEAERQGFLGDRSLPV